MRETSCGTSDFCKGRMGYIEAAVQWYKSNLSQKDVADVMLGLCMQCIPGSIQKSPVLASAMDLGPLQALQALVKALPCLSL